MVAYRTGVVVDVMATRPGLQRVRVQGTGRDPERAYVLTDQIGPVEIGDEVVFNTTAVDLGLGTGGWHFVHWNLARREFVAPGPGHIMKQRYTSLQIDTGAAEETIDPGTDLAGTPVVVATLHSQVPCVAAAFLAERPDARVVYVMTDGAALPIALSDLVVSMREAGLVHATITAGHAFGGDREAVSTPSALALAVHADHADLVIVAMGPGVVGTDTALGTTSVEAAAILDATHALGGIPILCVRASGADARPRHQGISHHVATVLALTVAAVDVPIVTGLDRAADHHRTHVVDGPDVVGLLADRGLRVTSMGRGPEDDPVFYAAAGAAGTWAARVGPADGPAR